jgi:hypothetical protein
MAADFVEPKPLQKYPVKSGRDILEAQYKGGRSVIDRFDWAREAYDSLRRRCTHVPEEELVRLFHDRGQSQLELIQGAAVFQEYNASHPIGRRRVKAKKAHLRPTPPPPPAVAKPAAKAPAKKAVPKPKAKPKAAPKAAKAKAKRKR